MDIVQNAQYHNSDDFSLNLKHEYVWMNKGMYHWINGLMYLCDLLKLVGMFAMLNLQVMWKLLF
jgi:hypothetical protein